MGPTLFNVPNIYPVKSDLSSPPAPGWAEGEGGRINRF